jgi:chaperonin GroEL (HSP60 family)
VLLESADGHVSCCNSGTQILSSLSLSHPVGSVIAKSVSNYHKSVGDGSKKMLIILKGIMEEVVYICVMLANVSYILYVGVETAKPVSGPTSQDRSVQSL